MDALSLILAYFFAFFQIVIVYFSTESRIHLTFVLIFCWIQLQKALHSSIGQLLTCGMYKRTKVHTLYVVTKSENFMPMIIFALNNLLSFIHISCEALFQCLVVHCMKGSYFSDLDMFTVSFYVWLI